MKHFFLCLLASAFSGAMAVGYVSRGVTAPADVGMGEVANSISGGSTDSNAAGQFSVTMKISLPYFVLPIPDKELNMSSPLPLAVNLTNTTPNQIRAAYDNLNPELIGPDGQALQLQRTREPRLNYKATLCAELPKPGTGILLSSTTLGWKNNKLQIYGDAGLGYRWYFDNIKPGTYQLRFTYSSPGGEVSCYDLQTQEFRKVEGLGSARGSTSFVPIRIVQPVSIDSNTVQIDGVRFELIMPERVLPIPENKPEATTPIKLGLRITNKTATPLHFRESYKKLVISGQDGKILRREGRDENGFLTVYNCPLVQPGENITFTLDARLSWENNKLQLVAPDGLGGFLYFGDIKPGKYQIRIGYYPWVPGLSCNSEIGRETLSEDIWEGLGYTPFVEFSLVQH